MDTSDYISKVNLNLIMIVNNNEKQIYGQKTNKNNQTNEQT